jgi:hypothetical protein
MTITINKKSNTEKGLGFWGFFTGLLTVAFICLKLGYVINWSWWWVLSPLWISFLLGIFGFVLAIIIFCVVFRDGM